jgi:hypothetical protein
MPWFRCEIEGEDFPLVVDGEVELHGFVTTRWVEADTPEAAELNAVAELRERLTPILSETIKPKTTKIVFPSVELADGAGQNLGLIWYPMNAEDSN